MVDGAADARAVPHRRPGGWDVARLAGVSQRTVSRVFNDEPHVTAEVRARVLAAAQKLGYRPNGAARALNTGRTRRIGVASLGSALFGPSSLLVAIERSARAFGYAVTIANTFEDDPAGLVGAVQNLLDQGVDAIVLSEPIVDDGPPLVVDVPVLTLGPAPSLRGPVVLSVKTGEGGEAAAQATRYLLDLGHRTVHHVGGPQKWWPARDRRESWRAVLEGRGAHVPEMLEGDWTPQSGYALGARLAKDPSVTAVFVANDDMAIGVMHALREAGLSVPDDISVVGFDDIPQAAHIAPALTTVRSDNAGMAAAGVEYLVAFLDSPSEPLPSPPEHFHRLVIRESTSAPSRRRGKGGVRR